MPVFCFILMSLSHILYLAMLRKTVFQILCKISNEGFDQTTNNIMIGVGLHIPEAINYYVWVYTVLN